MKRRGFLASTLAAGALGGLPVLRARADTPILSTAIVITDISAQSDPASVLRLARQLVGQGIWVTCAIRLGESADERTRLAGLLTALSEIGNGIDLALELPDLAGLSPYFQARAVFDARKRLQRALKGKPLFAAPQSVLCDEIENPVEPTGVRASGVRNVLLRPKADDTVRSETWKGGVVRFFGGQRIGPRTDFTFRRSTSRKENALLYYISASDLPGVAEDRLTRWTSRLASSLQEQELNAQLALMTVSDLQLRDNFAMERLVAILFDLPETATAADRAVVAAFRAQLERKGIPSALRPEGSLFWVGLGESDRPLIMLRIACAGHHPSRVATSMRVGSGFAVSFPDDRDAIPGIDGCAILQQPVVRIDPDLPAASPARRLAEGEDSVLLLSAGQIATPEAQRRMVAVLEAAREDGITQFIPIGAFAAERLTNEPVAIRHRLTRAAMANAPFRATMDIDDAERARLLKDARHAWGYIQTYQERATGLCPATVDTRPGGDIQRSVTMWDAGSNLNAIVAAAELGLIDRKQAEATFERILPNLAGRRTDERLLPQGWIRTDRQRWGIRDFDGCDCGRLLCSLDNMRRRFGMGAAIGKLVASWDLDKIVIGGKIHSVINRKLVSTFSSHCAHYSALGFRRWGLNPASPYETFADRAPGDGEMALLETIATIGPLGSEPLLLEAMELGMSPESAYLAEVLIAAMEEEYTAGNRLICVSETPIDREPWFIYQGLELGTGPRSWRLDTVGHRPEYMTKAMADDLMTFSTKAAFLWAAYRPGAFTRKLLDFARRNARGEVGFMSGINVRTRRPMAHYTDLNTNAIILQAIAHMLRTPG